MNKIDMRADKTAVRADKEENPTIKPPEEHELPIKDYQWTRVMVETEHYKLAVPDSRSRYFKSVMRYTMNCPECDGIGRYDDRGEVVCPECGLVISHRPNSNKGFAGTVYSDKYCQGSANEAGHRNRGASGDPHLRTQALRDPGPSNDADAYRD